MLERAPRWEPNAPSILGPWHLAILKTLHIDNLANSYGIDISCGIPTFSNWYHWIEVIKKRMVMYLCQVYVLAPLLAPKLPIINNQLQPTVWDMKPWQSPCFLTSSYYKINFALHKHNSLIIYHPLSNFNLHPRSLPDKCWL